jgi:hypothetical protein
MLLEVTNGQLSRVGRPNAEFWGTRRLFIFCTFAVVDLCSQEINHPYETKSEIKENIPTTL